MVCVFKHLYCSAQLSMSSMEKRYRNKIIIIIIIIFEISSKPDEYLCMVCFGPHPGPHPTLTLTPGFCFWVCFFWGGGLRGY